MAFCLIGIGPMNAQEVQVSSQAPASIDLTNFPGAIVDKVIVPVPGEVFRVLDKLGDPDWAEEIQLPESRISRDRIRLALVFGGTVAEGFIAVQAEQKEPIRDVGRRVLDLASALSLRDDVLPHYQAIDDGSQINDWRSVRQELDKTEQTVRARMVTLQDDELAELVSIGGWLRGTKAVSALVAEGYSVDKAEVLNQPELVKHFEGVIGRMSQRTREKDDVILIADGLADIREILVAAEEEGISEVDVIKVGEICDVLLGRFYFDVEVEEKGAAQ